MIGCFQDSLVSGDIGHGTILCIRLQQSLLPQPRDSGVPKSVKSLSTRYPRDHIHRKRCDTTRRKPLHKTCILSRIQERDYRLALAQRTHFVIAPTSAGCADFQKDITLGPNTFAVDQRRAGRFVGLVYELSLGACATLNENTREALLEQKRDIWRRNGDSTLIRICFAWYAYRKG